MFVHAALAGATNIPELAITEDEGKNLARAIADVQAHYGAVLDPKTQAWVNLAIVAGATYVPRVGMARMRMQAEQKRATPAPTLEETLSVAQTAPQQPPHNAGGFEFDFNTPPPNGNG